MWPAGSRSPGIPAARIRRGSSAFIAAAGRAKIACSREACSGFLFAGFPREARRKFQDRFSRAGLLSAFSVASDPSPAHPYAQEDFPHPLLGRPPHRARPSPSSPELRPCTAALPPHIGCPPAAHRAPWPAAAATATARRRSAATEAPGAHRAARQPARDSRHGAQAFRVRSRSDRADRHGTARPPVPVTAATWRAVPARRRRTARALNEFQGDDVAQVLRLLARQAKISLVVSDKISDAQPPMKVTMRLEDKTPHGGHQDHRLRQGPHH